MLLNAVSTSEKQEIEIIFIFYYLREKYIAISNKELWISHTWQYLITYMKSAAVLKSTFGFVEK